MRTTAKQEHIINLMIEEKLDLLCLQETWHSKDSHTQFLLQLQSKNIHCHATKAKEKGQHGEGTMILTRKGTVCNVAPTLQQFWKEQATALIIHVKDKAKKAYKLAIINFYSPHKTKQKFDGHLQFIANSLKQFHQGINVIVTGDFNRRLNAVTKLAESMNLQTLRIPTALCQATRSVVRNGQMVKSEIDFFLSNTIGTIFDNQRIAEHSDHHLLVAEFSIQSEGDHRKIVTLKHLSEGATIEVYEEIMANDRWPKEPFMQIAHELSKTHNDYRKCSDAHRVLKAARAL